MAPVTTEPSPPAEATDGADTAAILEAIDALSRELTSERRAIGESVGERAVADELRREVEALRTAIEALESMAAQSASGVVAAAPVFQAGELAWTRFIERHTELDRARAAALLTDVIVAGERREEDILLALRHWALGLDEIVVVFGSPKVSARGVGDSMWLEYHFEPALDLLPPLAETIEFAWLGFDAQGRLTTLSIE
ncbi:hypothetical protein [Rohdeia mirabilis]|uniref:hypothetical protein n=1 Tax=Rohdeia mirabilis TaxID=2528008 RepID=UPI003AF3673F